MNVAEQVLVLTGCTASGKTSAVMRLAELLPIEVISADSRQIYRGMDVGTAKPTAAERARVPHHLLDILDPDGRYSAGEFAIDAVAAISSIRAAGRIPVVVGGTVLYLIALIGCFDSLPGTHAFLRSGLSAADDASPGLLRRILTRLDPVSAARIAPADVVRTLRALEITLVSGRPASSLRSGGSRRKGFVIIGIDLEAGEIRRRIARRTSVMLREGLLEETRALLSRGYGRESAPGRTIGYCQAIDVLEGLSSPEELSGHVETATWKYARRQRNMIRRLGPDAVLDGDDRDGLAGFVMGQEGFHAESC